MKESDDYLKKIDDIIEDIKDENLFDKKNSHRLADESTKKPKHGRFSKRAIKQKLIDAFYPPFIHAGISDAITTVIGLNMGLVELNPLIANLYPTQIVLIPAVLIAFAYGRALSAILLFRSKKYLKPMLWFTLYFPAIFNAINIIWFYFHLENLM